MDGYGDGDGDGILDLLEPWRFTHLLIGPGVGRRGMRLILLQGSNL